jgi:hypothetical protein
MHSLRKSVGCHLGQGRLWSDKRAFSENLLMHSFSITAQRVTGLANFQRIRKVGTLFSSERKLRPSLQISKI